MKIYNYSMKTFQKIINRTSEWVGVVFSCAIIFFFLIQFIILVVKM